jgi:aryl-alcohol dehydrogenase-like predicted oxidoreductase
LHQHRAAGFSNGHSHSQALALNVSNLASSPDAEQWEYKLISAASEQDVIDQANQLGIQGWKLVSVVRVSASPAWRAFFKRVTKD